MKDEQVDLIRRLVEQERECLGAERAGLTPTVEEPGVQHTELPEDSSDGTLAREWNVYRREVGRLLAEGHEGRVVLIKGDDIIGIFDNWGAARNAGLERFLREPFFVHPIRATEPFLRIGGIKRPGPGGWRLPPERPGSLP
jgi:hypothetical protein